jgi:hypothetical protein
MKCVASESDPRICKPCSRRGIPIGDCGPITWPPETNRMQMEANNRRDFANEWVVTDPVATQIAFLTSEIKIIKESLAGIQSAITGPRTSAISSLTGAALPRDR